MGKKKVKAPTLQQWEGNEYTKQLESDLGGYHDWVQSNWENALTAPTIESYYDYVKQVNEPAMQDFLQDYNRQSNALASRNYNRFGGLTSTPALYTQDIYNKQMNDLATRQASQMLSDAYSMKNQDWANALNALGVGYNLYTNTGDYLTQNKDIPNWNIQNMNEVNRVNAYNQNAQNSGFNLGGMLSGIASGASAGSVAGPWGAVIGGVAGGALGGASNYLGSNNAQAGIQGIGSGLQGLNNWSLNTKGKGLFQ